MIKKIIITFLVFLLIVSCMPAFAEDEPVLEGSLTMQSETEEIPETSEEVITENPDDNQEEVKKEENKEDKIEKEEVKETTEVKEDVNTKKEVSTKESEEEPEELKDDEDITEEVIDDEVHPKLVKVNETLPKILPKDIDSADDIKTIHLTTGTTYRAHKYSDGNYWSVPQDSPASLTARKIDKINGKKLSSLDDIDASYLYCAEPGVDGPATGTYNVDDIYDGTETNPNLLAMRKIIWYMPGGKGWNTTTKSRWYAPYESAGGETNAMVMCSAMISHFYKAYRGSAWGGTADILTYDGAHNSYASLDTTWALKWINDLPNLPDPPTSFKVFFIRNEKVQDLFGALYMKDQVDLTISKTVSNKAATSGNSLYSVVGSKFKLYDSEADAKADTDAKASFTIGSNGKSETRKIDAGAYYVVETQAGPGLIIPSSLSKANGGKRVVITQSGTIGLP